MDPTLFLALTNQWDFSVSPHFPLFSFFSQVMDICIFTVLSWYFYNTGSSNGHIPNFSLTFPTGEKGSHPLFFLTREYWRSFLPKKQYDMPTVTPVRNFHEISLLILQGLYR